MTEALLSLIVTAVLLLASPGPAPIALAAAGATVGFRKGLPFLGGMLAGFYLVVLLTVLGLSALFAQFPLVNQLFLLASSLFLFYIAYKIATSESLISTAKTNVLTFKTGFIINSLNPKAYAAMVALLSQFSQTVGNSTQQLIIAGLVLLMLAVIIDVTWLAIGRTIKPLFNNVKYQHGLRYCFAIALAVVVAVNLFKTLM